MREEIRDALIDGVPEVEGRIFEPHTASADTKKPYLIVKETGRDDNTKWAGFRAGIEVWPYCEQSSYTEVDALARKINDALNMQLLVSEEGDAVTCIADGMEADVVDAEWDALTRCVNFYVLSLQPSDMPGPLENDPWIDALVSWTQDKIGADYAVYGGKLPVGYVRPSVLWRADELDIDDAGAAAFDVKKVVVAHVFGRNAVEEANVAAWIVEEMGAAVKIPINASKRRYMTLKECHAQLYTDAMKQGHIRATVTRKTRKPREEMPPIGEVFSNGHTRIARDKNGREKNKRAESGGNLHG